MVFCFYGDSGEFAFYAWGKVRLGSVDSLNGGSTDAIKKAPVEK